MKKRELKNLVKNNYVHFLAYREGEFYFTIKKYSRGLIEVFRFKFKEEDVPKEIDYLAPRMDAYSFLDILIENVGEGTLIFHSKTEF